MSKNIKRLCILLGCVFILYLCIDTLNAPSQNAVRAICTGLSIDKESNETKVCAQIIIPEAGGQYAQKLSVIENKGASVEEALEKMEFQIGKKIRLGHCGFIVMSSEYAKTDITKDFDYFLRGNNLGNNTLLLFTTGESKKVLESASNVNSNEVDNLQINTKYSERHLFSKSANVISFFNDYLSPHSTSHMPNLVVNSQKSSSESGGGDSQNQEKQSKPSKDSIKADGSVAIFYQGKFSFLLSPTEREDFNWLDKSVKGTRIRLENITTDKFENANLSFTLSHKKIDFGYQFINGEPTIHINFRLGLKPEAISDTNVSAYTNIVDSVVQNAISQKINKALEKVLTIEKEHEFDVFNFYRQFNIHCHTEWQKYVNSLGADEHYLKHIKIVAKVSAYDDF